MNIDVNYKNNRRYNTARYPIRQPIYLTALIWLLSRFALLGKRKYIKKQPVQRDRLLLFRRRISAPWSPGQDGRSPGRSENRPAKGMQPADTPTSR